VLFSASLDAFEKEGHIEFRVLVAVVEFTRELLSNCVDVVLVVVTLLNVEEPPELEGIELRYTPSATETAIIGITAKATSLLLTFGKRLPALQKAWGSYGLGTISFLGIAALFCDIERVG
jgi:hypothetical protein